MSMDFYVQRDSSVALTHHGIEGQKWGVRRGPPYPIDDKVMRKGEHLRSITPYTNSKAYQNRGRPMYTYNANDEYDNKVYRGPFAMYNMLYRGALFLSEHEYETVKDLTMPTKQERMQEFKDLYDSKKDKKTVINEMEKVRQRLVANKIGNEEMQKSYANIDLSNLSTKKDWDVAYEIFNHAMENVNNYKTTSKYLKNMSKKYDAMVDDNNQGIYNGAHDPVIIFKANKVLKSVSTNPVSYEEITKAYKEVETEMKKKGERVFL